MRNDKEIIDRINERKNSDYFGFECSDLVSRLPFSLAKQFLIEGAVESEWEISPRDKESILKEMLVYMPFAFEKANNERGLSASRSMSHYQAWVWLAGDDLGDLLEYEFYGKDNLVMICKHYGWDASQWDDGVRNN